ncbi:tetratricopeptide repeat protein [Streptomyces sp. NPDC048606]|uniref:tetratricopeptide repeat protein n=1 Tax=Streptomyces sp. NPDC048606 TaxID=3154726 RepID=UPI00341E61F5
MTAYDEAREFFAAGLAEVRAAAGTPSFEELGRRGERRLPKSTVNRVLRGDFQEPPSWDLVQTFLEVCEAIAAESKGPEVSAAHFDLEVWRGRYGRLEVLWEAHRGDEDPGAAGTPLPGVRRFPPAGVRPAADLLGQPSQLLLARHEVVPFTGRADDLAALIGWRDGKQPEGARREGDQEAGKQSAGKPVAASVALLYGRGGQGKTRLAGELARRTAVVRGWKVWQATRTGAVVPVDGRPGQASLGGSALVVVDYAERWPAPELESLLGALVARRGARLRVLLIARSAGWWSYLLDDLRTQGYEEQAAFPLRALPDGDLGARVEAFEVARACFAEALGLDEEEAASLATPEGLGRAEFGLMLTVQMAALVAVDARIRGAEPPRDPGGLSRYLLDRERGHWAKVARRPDRVTSAEVMGQAVFTATLTRPRRHEVALAALRAAGVDGPASHRQVLREHADCYPAAEPRTYLEPLYPDRLGEDFVALSTPDDPDDPHRWAEGAAARLLGVAGDVPSGAPASSGAADASAPEWSRDVLTNLINAAARWPHLAAHELAPLAVEHPRIVLRAGNAALAALARIEEVPLEALEAIEAVAPSGDPDLDVGIAEITDRFSVDRIRSAPDPTARATLYSKRAWRLSNTGRHEEALTAIEEAIGLHRMLAGDGDVEHRADLAWALNSRSNEQHWTGDHRAALESAEESVALFAAVVNDDPKKIANLAVAFTTLSLRLDQQGRTAQGLGLLEEAVRITRLTAEANPAIFRPDLASMLHNLGGRLSAVGRYRDAHAAETEAVAIYRQLVEQDPRAHLGSLANALDGVAVALSGEGRHREGLVPREEAAALLRAGAEDNPGAYQPVLANTLLNLGADFGESGALREAVRRCRESVALSRELVERSRPAHLPGLARSLMVLGIWLGKSGAYQEAVVRCEEAVASFRELVALDSESHLPGLAEALLNLGPRASEAGRAEQAEAACREAVALHRQLLPSNPVVFRSRLAITLVNLGNRLAQGSAAEEAVVCFREAAELAREVAEENPGKGLPILAGVLTNLGRQLNAVRRHAESVTVAREAVDLQRSMVRGDPRVHEPGLAAALAILCDTLKTAGRYEEAATCGAEAVALLERLAADLPDVHRPHLGLALRNHGRALAALERKHEAVVVAEREVEVWRHLAQGDPGGHAFELTVALDRLGALLAEVRMHHEAVRVGRQAVALWRDMDHPAAERLLAFSLGSLGRPLAALDRHEELTAAGEEAVVIWRRLAERDPAAHRPHLVMGLFYGLGLPLAQAKRWPRAEGPLREAVDLQRRLADEDPGAHRPHLAHMLVAVVLMRITGQRGLREALGAAEEAVTIYEALARLNPAFRPPLHEAARLRAHLRDSLPPEGRRRT